MAYRRRKTYRRKGRRKALSDRQVRAVQSIVAGNIETKHYINWLTFGTWLNISGYTGSADSWATTFNIFDGIPTEVLVPTVSDGVVGQEFDARGFKVILDLSSSAGTAYNLFGRITFFKTNIYNANAGTSNQNPVFLPNSNNLFDGEFPLGPTIGRWDTDVSVVLKQKRFRLGFMGDANARKTFKWWFPMRGKKIIKGDAKPRVGELQGWQYYFALEFYAPGVTNMTSVYGGNVSTEVYFKDA